MTENHPLSPLVKGMEHIDLEKDAAIPDLMLSLSAAVSRGAMNTIMTGDTEYLELVIPAVEVTLRFFGVDLMDDLFDTYDMHALNQEWLNLWGPDSPQSMDYQRLTGIKLLESMSLLDMAQMAEGLPSDSGALVVLAATAGAWVMQVRGRGGNHEQG